MSNILRHAARTIAAAGLTASCVAAAAPAAHAVTPPDKTIRVISLNDFHGNLEPPTGAANQLSTPGGTMVDVGGAAYLATHIKQMRQRVKYNVTVSAGDMIGASPLTSALFRDEPTIEAMHAMALDVAGVGNHEFDDGVDELLRIDRGGCHPIDGCFGEPYRGARFPILAANVVDLRTDDPVLPPVTVKEYAGFKVGFIGLTLEGTDEIVAAQGIKNVQFEDEVATVNNWSRVLRDQGVKIQVVLIHEGGNGTGKPNECGPGTRNSGLTGPITTIAKRISSNVDAIASAHTHQAYICNVPDPQGRPRFVTSAASFGRAVTAIDLRVSGETGDVIRDQTKANNRLVTRDVTPDAKQLQILAKWQGRMGPIASRVIGTQTADITRATGGRRDRESSLSNMIADAQVHATQAPELGGAQLALMNPGGVRADLTYAATPNGGTDGQMTYGEIYAVQPFGNNLVTMTLTGSQIERTLEQQWTLQSGGTERQLHLGISDGLRYSYDPARPLGDRIDPASITLNGAPLNPAGSYRVTVNSFLADGGDGFLALKEGTNRITGSVDLDAFEGYVRANSPVSPAPANRVTILN